MNRFSPRPGLAPLELVLAMPLLMMIMALMIVFGNAAYWKVRGLSVARNAAWSNRWPRSGFDEPTPQPWAPGQYARRTADDIQSLDEPQLKHPVVRGPLGNFDVNEKLLDPSRGVVEGHATGKIEPAMMPALKEFTYRLEHGLIDDKFQYPQMGIPGNVHRRIPFIYTLPKAEEAVSGAWVSAALAVMNSPLQPALKPLDEDEEIYAHYGSYRDFHPRLARFCSLDLQSAWESQTRRLIGSIKGRQRPRVAGLPERMASAWINMYQSEVNTLKARIDELQTQIMMGTAPTDAATQISQAQARIDELEARIETLKQFRARARQQPDTADGPVPPLAMLRINSGNVAGATLRPIPAALMELIAPVESACCGQTLPIEKLLGQLEQNPDVLEERP